MNSSGPLPREEVERRRAMLRALQEEAPDEEVAPRRWSYRMAACVLSTFDPQTLRPMDGEGTDGGALRWLMEDCEVVSGTDGPARWMMKESVRREAIERLGSAKALSAALRCNPVKTPDPLQWVINQYLNRGSERVDEANYDHPPLASGENEDEAVAGGGDPEDSIAPEEMILALDDSEMDDPPEAEVPVADLAGRIPLDDPGMDGLPDAAEQGMYLLDEDPEVDYPPEAEEPEADPSDRALSWLVADAAGIEYAAPENADQIARLLQVVRWFGRVAEGPEQSARAEAELSQRLARARLLAPFRKLAGPTFRGRKDELEKLRVHVGVLDTSVTKTLTSYARRVLGMGDGTSLLIHGPGGMGKSALLARFVLEHSNTVPFAYLDFDHPHVSLDKPVTLLMEASRQLALQYPDSQTPLAIFEARCRKALGEERLRRTGGRRVASGDVPGGSARDLWVPLAEAFGELLMTQVLHRWAEQGGPYLLLLDTFEEVQYRNADLVRELEHLLTVLRSRYPQLKVVLSGRAPEPRLKSTELVLKGLDEASALSLLEASGVPGDDLRRGLFAQVGGNPLSLKLAAEVARVEEVEAEGLRGLKTKRLFFFAAREAVVQGQLYRRVLEHVHDADVRKLAHPGLIVRRLTPDIITEVLAGPCGLGNLSSEQAQSLFEKLQREVSLVSVGPDGALYHRADVRRVMLEPLRLDQPERVAAIHAAAVRYYAQFSDVVSRAEELYHRMASGQPREVINPRWIPGVEPYLRSSLEELPAEVQAYACSFLGVDLPREVWERAQLEDWERHVVRRLKDLLLKGEPRWALEVLHERRERTPGSVLYVIEARVLILLGREAEAEQLVEEGLDRAGWAADSVVVLKLLLLRALLLAAHEDLPLALKVLEDADRFAADRVCEPARVLPLMASVRLWRLHGYGSAPHLHAVQTLAAVLLRLPYEELHRVPQFYLKALDVILEVGLTERGEPLDALLPLRGDLEQWRRSSGLERGPEVFLRREAVAIAAAVTASPERRIRFDALARLLSEELTPLRYLDKALLDRVPTLKPPEGMSFGPLTFLLEMMS